MDAKEFVRGIILRVAQQPSYSRLGKAKPLLSLTGVEYFDSRGAAFWVSLPTSRN